MNAHLFASELHALLTGHTSPAGMSERKLDDRADRGCEAGNRLAPVMRRVANYKADTPSHPAELCVWLKDGGTVTITIEYDSAAARASRMRSAS